MLHNKTVNWALVSIKSCDFKANSGGYPLEIMSQNNWRFFTFSCFQQDTNAKF